MERTNITMKPIELLERLGAIAALAFEIGVEEDDDEIRAFKDVISIVGKVKELPDEAISKALMKMSALITAVKNTEPGKERILIGSDRKWVPARDIELENRITLALESAVEFVKHPDERNRVNGMINYLKDFWESPL